MNFKGTVNLKQKLTGYKPFFGYCDVEFCESNKTITANITLHKIQEAIYSFSFFDDIIEFTNVLNIFTEFWT